MSLRLWWTRSLWRQDSNRLNLKQGAGTRQLRHPDRGACWRRRRVDVFVTHLAVMRDVGANVQNISIKLDDVGEACADKIQSRLHIPECYLHLLTSIGAHLAGFIDAKLAGEIDRAAGPGHFHYVAIAGRLLHCVGI